MLESTEHDFPVCDQTCPSLAQHLFHYEKAYGRSSATAEPASAESFRSDTGIGSGGIRWFQSSEQVPEGWPGGTNTKAARSGCTLSVVHLSEVADYPKGCPTLDGEESH